MRRVTNLCLPALALLALTSLGCSAREKSICDKRITCEGGNDKDKSACVDSYIQDTVVAEAYKCGDAHSLLLDCLDTTSICQSGSPSGCRPSRAGAPGQHAQRDAANSCQKAASAQNK